MARLSLPIHQLVFILQLNLFITILAKQAYLRDQESDRVLNIPGQPSTPSISQFAGYINVDEEEGRALFYWFFEAQSEPSSKPLLLWLSGGPGCSSLLGTLVEVGPLTVKSNGTGVEFNKYAWNRDANLLFLESPAGVGFSYTNTSSFLTGLTDAVVAEDTYTFLINWLKRFPQYQDHDFYITGESYAGHFVPQLAELVLDRNKEKNKFPFINLKGFIIGNALSDDYYDSRGLVDFAWSHTVMTDEAYKLVNRVCDFRVFNWSDACNDAINELYTLYQEIDIYNIYAPTCVANNSASSTMAGIHGSADYKVSRRNLRNVRIHPGYDPCYVENLVAYLNRDDVQKSIHASLIGDSDGQWGGCNDIIFGTYNYTVFSVLPLYHKLIEGGLKIWLYSGDTDGRVPTLGSRYNVGALGLPVKSPWRYWYHRQQVGGRVVEYDGVTLATVKGAGHMVPFNKRSEALLILSSFLDGSPLPSTR